MESLLRPSSTRIRSKVTFGGGRKGGTQFTWSQLVMLDLSLLEGTLKGYQAKLHIKEGQPIFCKALPVPNALRAQVESELERLVQCKIIQPISFSDWAASIVPVMKPDKSVRICGDFKLTVNRVFLLDCHPIPKVEDLFAKLSGGVIFSKLDLSSAYQQLELEEESK